MTQLSLKEVINVIMENIMIPAASKITLIIMPGNWRTLQTKLGRAMMA